MYLAKEITKFFFKKLLDYISEVVTTRLYNSCDSVNQMIQEDNTIKEIVDTLKIKLN
jgi:chromosomal replication initiation ATPase DnaA